MKCPRYRAAQLRVWVNDLLGLTPKRHIHTDDQGDNDGGAQRRNELKRFVINLSQLPCHAKSLK